MQVVAEALDIVSSSRRSLLYVEERLQRLVAELAVRDLTQSQQLAHAPGLRAVLPPQD
jgi:hypothetical protein